MSEQRDLRADLEICEKAIIGPWKYDHEEIKASDTVTLIFETVQYAEGQNLLRLQDKPTAEFIAQARTGWPEAIERAIKAEEELARLGKRFPVTIDKKTQVIVDRKAFDACMGDNAALREENDLQRHSIQQLSAQVVAYRDGLKEMQARCEFRIMDDDGHYENYHEAKDLLSSPDPGAEIRERLAKLEAVATVAGAISSGCYDANIWDKLKQALAEMEGGHR